MAREVADRSPRARLDRPAPLSPWHQTDPWVCGQRRGVVAVAVFDAADQPAAFWARTRYV